MRNLLRIPAAAALAGAVLAAAAPAANADSVAYVKGGDLFLTTTDGGRQVQVTNTGGYSTVSQADDGRLVALHGDHIRTLSRDGKVLADILTPVSSSTDPNMAFKGPFDPEVSPDGKKIAYTYYWQYIGEDPYCNPSTGCYVERLYHGTGFTRPDRLTAWDEPGFAKRSGWIDAAWVDNDQVLLSDPYIQPNEDVVLWSPTQGEESLRRWYQDPLYGGEVSEATISRDGSAMAQITEDGKGLSILSSDGRFYPEYPNRCYESTVTEEGEKISSPTFSADGRTLFFASAKGGVHAAGLPDFVDGNCPDATDPGKLIVPGGASPSWGPADVPVKSTVPDPGEEPGDGDPQPQVKLTVAKVKLASALRQGLTVRVAGAAAGRHAVAVRLGKAKVAGGALTVGPAGTAKAKLRFTAAGRRKLAGRRTARLAVTAAGATVAVTLVR